MKKKWYVWGIILVVFSLFRYISGYLLAYLANKTENAEFIKLYNSLSFLISPVVFIVCIVGICITHKNILSGEEQQKYYNYRFEFINLFVFIKIVIDVLSVFNVEGKWSYLENKLMIKSGVDVPIGHSTGIISLFYIIVGIVLFIISVCFSGMLQKKYNKFRLERNKRL